MINRMMTTTTTMMMIIIIITILIDYDDDDDNDDDMLLLLLPLTETGLTVLHKRHPIARSVTELMMLLLKCRLLPFKQHYS